MKFLIDAHLPPSLRGVFQAAGHDAIHTLDLPDKNASRDGKLNEVSLAGCEVSVRSVRPLALRPLRPLRPLVT